MNSTIPNGSTLEVVRYHATAMQKLAPTYLLLLASSVFPIFTAAHASLRRPANARAPPRRKSKDPTASQEDEDESEDESSSSSPLETLSVSDAILFPVLAGVTLSSLYLIIKWLDDPSILNKILGYYFTWTGLFFSFKFMQDTLNVLSSLIFPAQYSRGNLVFRVSRTANHFEATDHKTNATQVRSSPFAGIFSTLPLPKRLLNSLWGVRRVLTNRAICTLTTRSPLPTLKTKFTLTSIDLVSLTLSMLLAIYQSAVPAARHPWLLTNLVGTSFCHGTLQFISTGTARIGTLLLSLLFCYDIYMVFFTPMMVTVATKLDVPIKLLFPKPQSALDEAKGRAMAMLGLGDVVVPGIVIAWALRLDLWNYYNTLKKGKTRASQETAEHDERAIYRSSRGSWGERFFTSRKLYEAALRAKDFPKPYFRSTVIGYVCGMVVTLVVMQVWQHAQPALLYLVPGVLSGLWGCAAVKGELKFLWSEYDESEEEEDGKVDGSGEKAKSEQKDEETSARDEDVESRDDRQKERRPMLTLTVTSADARR